MTTNPEMQGDGALKQKLKEMILKACQVEGVTPAEINDDEFIINGPGPLQLDSLDALEIAMALRREFGIEMEEASSSTAAMRSINSLAQFVREREAAGLARNVPA